MYFITAAGEDGGGEEGGALLYRFKCAINLFVEWRECVRRPALKSRRGISLSFGCKDGWGRGKVGVRGGAIGAFSSCMGWFFLLLYFPPGFMDA